MTDTWVPAEGDKIKCIDDSYTNCEEKPFVNQIGEVLKIDISGGRKILIIEFNVVDGKNIPGAPHKKKFKEYFCTSRQCNLYFDLHKAGEYDPNRTH